MKHLFEQIFQKPLIALISGIGLLNKRIKVRQKIDGAVSRFIHLVNRRQLSDEEDLSATEKIDLPESEKQDFKSSVSGMVKNQETFLPDLKSGALLKHRATNKEYVTDQKKKKDFEETGEMERDLRDDKLKLVRYKVLFTKRDYEHAFEEHEDLLSDNIDEKGFTAWKVAEFIQRLAEKNTRVPEKWLRKNYPPPEYREGSMLKGLPDEDKKYLRVYHHVSDRYEREKFRFDEEQIDVLREIRDRIRDGKNS